MSLYQRYFNSLEAANIGVRLLGAGRMVSSNDGVLIYLLSLVWDVYYMNSFFEKLSGVHTNKLSQRRRKTDVCFKVTTHFILPIPDFGEVCVAHLFSFLCCCFVFCCVCSRLVCPMLPVSLNCPFLIASSVFYNVYIVDRTVHLLQR